MGDKGGLPLTPHPLQGGGITEASRIWPLFLQHYCPQLWVAKFPGSISTFPCWKTPLHAPKSHQASPLLWVCPDPSASGLILSPLSGNSLGPHPIVSMPGSSEGGKFEGVSAAPWTSLTWILVHKSRLRAWETACLTWTSGDSDGGGSKDPTWRN